MPPRAPCTAAARTARDQPYVAAQQHVQQQCVCTGCYIVLGLPCFYDPPSCRGPGTAPFDAPRWPSRALGAGISPIRPCAAVWSGRGAVGRPRGRSGDAQERRSKTGYQVYGNRHSCEDLNRNDDVVSVLPGIWQGYSAFWLSFLLPSFSIPVLCLPSLVSPIYPRLYA